MSDQSDDALPVWSHFVPSLSQLYIQFDQTIIRQECRNLGQITQPRAHSFDRSGLCGSKWQTSTSVSGENITEMIVAITRDI